MAVCFLRISKEVVFKFSRLAATKVTTKNMVYHGVKKYSVPTVNGQQ